ncbi:hypothetical protein KSS87_023519 [Heliosperma pusillum]|nr:hypothetical protein KSS87_023519 [Heliosperma pusillum]
MDPTSSGGVSGGGGVDTESETPAAMASRWSFMVSQRFQHLLDKSTPFILYRWISLFFLAFFYALRVYFVEGFYVVSYGLGIYILNLFIGFLSPQVDPEIQELTDGPTLPTRGSDDVFDVPVFWPILLFYWFVLFMLTMRRQIHHMIKYKYVPFSFGKKQQDMVSSGSPSFPVFLFLSVKRI